MNSREYTDYGMCKEATKRCNKEMKKHKTLGIYETMNQLTAAALTHKYDIKLFFYFFLVISFKNEEP